MTSVEKIFLPARDGTRLEGVLQWPTTIERCPAVVITHSHSLQAGGHSYAHVLRAVAAQLAYHGFVALRINFRGVQGSSGAFENGQGEVLDIGGAVDFLRADPRIDPEAIALFGYSFGSRVCLPYAVTDPRIVAIATLGMPARRFLQQALPLAMPILLIAGEHDHVVPAPQIEQFVALHPTTAVHYVPAADHYYRGREDEVAAAVVQFLQTALSKNTMRHVAP